MTNFAPVGPLEAYYELDKAGQLGHYQLLIAPIILERSKEYHDFFEAHDDQFVVVDNGVIELGQSLSASDIKSAADIVQANLVVMPDTIDDAKATLRQTAEALEAFRELDEATDTMGVVQGVTFEECVECARQLVSLGVDWLAVPRGLTPNLGTRVPLVQALADEFHLPMHVLGFSDRISDDIAAATAHPLVRGIDAATPVWTDVRLPHVPPRSRTFSLSLGRRPKNFWSRPPAEPAAHNVATVRRWLSDAQPAPTGEAGPAGLTESPTQP